MFKVLALSMLLGQTMAATKTTTGSLRTATTTTSRQLSEPAIAGYPPRSDVTDHNQLDLDQAALEAQLADGNFDAARAIYTQGAYSKSFASLTVPALTQEIASGTKLEVVDASGSKLLGKALVKATLSSVVVQFQYTSSGCNVGGLPAGVRSTGGCLPDAGTLQIAGQNEITYTYDPTTDNQNARTLAGFSTNAEEKMHNCGVNCPYVTYQKFTNYYDNFSYGHAFVSAAFDKTTTAGFARGQMDFSGYEDIGRAEIIKKASAYMNVWMYVIREMEDALDDCAKRCVTCNDDSVHAWDEAVAFYAGSLEGQDGGSGEGVMPYALADKRCQNFKTCGEDQNMVQGTSKVNIDIFRQFKIGQNDLLQENCDAARKTKENIEKLMAVPLIQGTLRYAWITDYQAATSTDKEDAEGAIFAASVLPLVYDCNKDDAQFIYDNMRAGEGSPDFKGVKAAFERNYACMGVTCEAVGGLYDDTDGTYLPNASPCGGSGGNRTAAIVGGVLGGICAALLLVIVWMKVKGGGASGKDNTFVEGSSEVQ